MFDIKINLAIIFVDILLIIFGVLTWTSGPLANELGLTGLGRFFTGLLCIGIGLFIAIAMIYMNKN